MAKGFLRQTMNRSRRRKHLVAAGAFSLALGAVVLLRAPATGAEGHEPFFGVVGGETASGESTNAFSGPSLSGTIDLSQRAIQGGGEQTIFAEVNLRAGEGMGATGERSPVAIAVVLDTSGSMIGAKIEQARNALSQLVARMSDEDQIAIVTYSHSATTLWALSSVAELRPRLIHVVQSIRASGGTAIPAGLELGAHALNGANDSYARRVVLVSDGQDGSMVPMPQIRADILRHSQRGLAFSALGLGLDYDETFLTNVADAGSGNYAFVAPNAELHPFLQGELDQVRDALVDQVVAEMDLPAGWRVSQSFGLVPRTNGRTIELPIGQIASTQSRKVVVQLTGPAGGLGNVQQFAVRLRYRTLADSEHHSMQPQTLALTTVSSPEETVASRVPAVYARSQAVQIDADQGLALEAWRNGDTAEAQRLTEGNRYRLEQVAQGAPAGVRQQLDTQGAAFEDDLDNFRAVAPASAAGRAYGLGSNSARRGRAVQ